MHNCPICWTTDTRRFLALTLNNLSNVIIRIHMIVVVMVSCWGGGGENLLV